MVSVIQCNEAVILLQSQLIVFSGINHPDTDFRGLVYNMEPLRGYTFDKLKEIVQEGTAFFRIRKRDFFSHGKFYWRDCWMGRNKNDFFRVVGYIMIDGYAQDRSLTHGKLEYDLIIEGNHNDTWFDNLNWKWRRIQRWFHRILQKRKQALAFAMIGNHRLARDSVWKSMPIDVIDQILSMDGISTFTSNRYILD